MKIKNANGEITVSPKEKEKEQAVVDFNKAGNVSQKVDAIAEYLGIKK